MKQLQAVAAQPPQSAGSTPQNVELRHLRYFVAVAEAGTFTEAAQRMFIAQPTLSHQLRRLEDIVGTRLLHRRREGVRRGSSTGGRPAKGSSGTSHPEAWPLLPRRWPHVDRLRELP